MSWLLLSVIRESVLTHKIPPANCTNKWVRCIWGPHSWLCLQKGLLTWFSVQFSSVTQLCPTLCDPMNCSTPGLPVRHQLPEFTQTHVHRVSDAIQPSHPLLSPFPPAPNPSQHESFPVSQLFAWGSQSTGVSALASFLLCYTFVSFPQSLNSVFCWVFFFSLWSTCFSVLKLPIETSSDYILSCI